MTDALPVIVPLLNPNETEARLVSLHVKNGKAVKPGDAIAALETTKSTFELLTETKGYVAGLTAKPGEMLRAGATLCFIAKSKSWKAPKAKESKSVKADSDGVPSGLRITQPALLLAQKKGVDLAALPIGPIITEEQIQNGLSKSPKAGAFKIPENAASPNAVIVYGGGGHGKAVIDLLRSQGGYTLIGVIDDSREPGDPVLDTYVIGGESALAALKDAGCKLALNAVGGIGAMSSRISVFKRLRSAGFDSPTLIHPSAVIEPSAKLGAGVQVFPHAHVGSEAKLGFGCIVNTGAIVSHDCVLADYVNLAPGAILAGAVRIDAGTLIGMGVTINLNVRIGAAARVGNGATIKEDVPDGGIVRAGAIWPS